MLILCYNFLKNLEEVIIESDFFVFIKSLQNCNRVFFPNFWQHSAEIYNSVGMGHVPKILKKSLPVNALTYANALIGAQKGISVKKINFHFVISHQIASFHQLLTMTVSHIDLFTKTLVA